MPSLGADMENGTVLEWLVKPGDSVKRGDIVAVVDTEKATIEVEIFQTGVIEKIIVPVGEKVPVGTLLAVIRAVGEEEVAPAKPPPVVIAPPKPATAPSAVPTLPPVQAAAPHRLRISPLAMRVAAERHIDVSTITGTGPGGAITKADVEHAVKKAAAAPAAAGPISAPIPPASKAAIAPIDHHAAMRKVIAAAMSRSKREAPHYYLGTHIDMTKALAWLQSENLKLPVRERLLYAVILLKAVALAAREFPEMNGWWVEGEFKPSDAVHVGVAISLRQGGLIAPAIHEVDKKNLPEIMANLFDLVKRVRSGVLRSSEIADATITVTSLGDQGVESVFGVIYPPQVALVGFGKIVERPWTSGGMLGVRSIIMASLSGDHRASDGHRGGLFLNAIDQRLQTPEKL
jgi:pyruvate dehydrogenase E2 component (dihydrolipoamide acetyltransferase)